MLSKAPRSFTLLDKVKEVKLAYHLRLNRRWMSYRINHAVIAKPTSAFNRLYQMVIGTVS